mmetsp:Transcript_20709/g.52431  ORF Transcript_20709/g.52431 Transcript_20709/m.52431 type:complete len:449 (-) Transcript_20709:13-1359(-)
MELYHDLECSHRETLVEAANKAQLDLSVLILALRSTLAILRKPAHLLESVAPDRNARLTAMSLRAHEEFLDEQAADRLRRVAAFLWKLLSPAQAEQLPVEKMFRLLCILNTNTFACEHWSVNEHGRPTGRGIFPTASLFNHSCRPNCCIVVHGRRISVRVISPIRKGEELTVTYIDTSLPVHTRQKRLLKGKFFLCDCVRCHPDASVEEAGSVRCPSCETGFIPAPNLLSAATRFLSLNKDVPRDDVAEVVRATKLKATEPRSLHYLLSKTFTFTASSRCDNENCSHVMSLSEMQRAHQQRKKLLSNSLAIVDHQEQRKALLFLLSDFSKRLSLKHHDRLLVIGHLLSLCHEITPATQVEHLSYVEQVVRFNEANHPKNSPTVGNALDLAGNLYLLAAQVTEDQSEKHKLRARAHSYLEKAIQHLTVSLGDRHPNTLSVLQKFNAIFS